MRIKGKTDGSAPERLRQEAPGEQNPAYETHRR